VEVEILDDRTDTPETRLGAMRDLLLAWEQAAPADDVLVVGTDNLLTASLVEVVRVAQSRRPAATVAVREAATLTQARRFGVAETDSEGRIIRWQEKPSRPACRTIGLCLYYFPSPLRQQVQAYLAQGGLGDAPGQFIEWLVARQPVYTIMTEGIWFDIGSEETYHQARKEWTHA
jgi:glucose-1-phosphate thymidylyltransferase